MCLGIPARILSIGLDHADLAEVNMAGVRRNINVGLLDDPAALVPGDWVLVHMGFALMTMTPEQAQDAFRALNAEREAMEEFEAMMRGSENSGNRF